MKEQLLTLAFSFVAISASIASSPSAPSSEPPSPPVTYGSAAVSRVIRVNPDGTLHCDIDDFPPVIGKNISVTLEGIEPVGSGAIGKDVIDFLEQTLIPKSGKEAPVVVLENIRRGPTFCLIADIRINGKDLAALLVEKGLARRIIRLEAAKEAPPATAPPAPLQIKSVAPSVTYVAARTSKIYHQSTCPHAKRLSTDKMLAFRTKQEAEQNGRRPCKTCNP